MFNFATFNGLFFNGLMQTVRRKNGITLVIGIEQFKATAGTEATLLLP